MFDVGEQNISSQDVKKSPIYVFGMRNVEFSIDILDNRSAPIHNYFWSHSHYKNIVTGISSVFHTSKE
jgi:hypothetical protein